MRDVVAGRAALGRGEVADEHGVRDDVPRGDREQEHGELLGDPHEPSPYAGGVTRSESGRPDGSGGGPGRPTSESGLPIEPVYGPQDLAGWDPAERLGEPGAYPYTRGIYPTMYTGRPWTMRQYAGFGTARTSNQRYHQLIEAGTHGLSVAF